MTSVLAAQSANFAPDGMMAQVDMSGHAQTEEPTLQRRPKTEPEDKNRGRRRSRGTDKTKEETAEHSQGEAGDGHSSETDGPSRKRRRSRKGLDKKFECPQPGCGKSYSRAEHL